jgi:hypothetical protein
MSRIENNNVKATCNIDWPFILIAVGYEPYVDIYSHMIYKHDSDLDVFD